MKYVEDCLLDLFAAYPHFKPPDPDRTIDVYTRALEGVPEWALRPAIDELLRGGGRFFPTASDIRQEVQRQNIQPPRNLTEIRCEMEQRAWAGLFDPAEWCQFEQELRQAGREHAAQHVAEKRTFFETYHAEEQTP